MGLQKAANSVARKVDRSDESLAESRVGLMAESKESTRVDLKALKLAERWAHKTAGRMAAMLVHQ